MENQSEIYNLLNQQHLEILTPVLKHSTFLRSRIISDPYIAIKALDKLGTTRTKETIFNEIIASNPFSMAEEDFLSFLRDFKFIEYILIAMEELSPNRDLHSITSHLSSFASAMLEIAYQYGYKKLSQLYGTPQDENNDIVGFAVIGLGKLGGWELNFSSDIDIMYVYGTEKGKTSGGTKGRLTNHEFFVKLGEKIKYYISERTEKGFVYRVDLRLRPDGDKGPLAMPIRSYETYYELYGQNWERMMLLKGSVVAGDKEIGEKLLSQLRPFIFRRSIDYKLINDLLDIKSKITSRVKLKGSKKDVKLGYGGIREIEFTIQALQILNYPKKPFIYKKNTLESITLLKEHGVLTPEEASLLEYAYRFLRKLEHMAQIELEQQTYVIPEDSERFDLYVERAGFNSAEELFEEYHRVTNQVNKIFNSIISEEKPDLSKIIADEELEIEDLTYFFKENGYKHPETVAEIIKKIFTKKGRGSNETKFLLKIMEIILNEIRELNESPKILNFFDRFFQRSDTIYLFYDIFASSPIILKKLINIIKYSNYLPNLILQNKNLLDYIYDPKDSDYTSNNIYEIFLDSISNIEDEEFEYNLTRKKFQELFFNIAYSYLNNGINVVNCGKSLTQLAHAVINFAFYKEYERVIKKYGRPMKSDGSLCDYLILGMGKLGSQEMSFGSDLDIIVLYEDEGYTETGKTNQEFFSKLVQKVISYLATPTVYGILYSIDMRLRPSGSKGALVTTFRSFKEYQFNKAMLWEKQALLRADVINKNSSLSDPFYTLVNDVLFTKSLNQSEINEIYDMRMRIQREKGEPYEMYDIKAGLGGIIDIEFSIQMLQLKHGHEQPELRKRNSHDLLHIIKDLELIKGRDFYSFHNNYIFYRNLENIIRIIDNKPSSKLPKSPEYIQKIAEFLNFKNSEKLFSQIDDSRKSVRNTFNRLFEFYSTI
ncbi:MAG: bifunctional [glutamate--ammonia ligase]-adenylyl-L-tyrosine phosphorylase/[glutamate--ammonia-ligase] adenylyltransferase [Calditerrivibrio sp.]|nr:bifunctional [glutamate--ammonia ligase]-adenylyl-L-tyrosine phosphorylase/[glutamate--ammonia-ligase] adenylyltransferase [Calditerrivibrio sp.]